MSQLRPPRVRVRRPGVLVVVTWLLLSAAGCAQSHPLVVIGTVADDEVQVTVPALDAVSPDLDAGFGTEPDQGQPGRARTSVVSALTSLGTYARVAEMAVSEGAIVQRGDVVARLDDAQQAAQVTVAEAAAATAHAQPGVLGAAIDRTLDKESELLDRRSQVEEAISTLITTRAELRQKRTQLTSTQAQLRSRASGLRAKRGELRTKRAAALTKRAELERQRAALEAVLAALPAEGAALPASPPGPTPPPTRSDVLAAIGRIDAGIAAIDAGVSQIDAGAAQIGSGLRKIRAGERQLRTASARIRAGLTTIDTRLSEARSGLATIDRAVDQLRDTRRELRHLRKRAVIAADSADLAVRTARDQLARTVLTSPVDGVVVRAVAAGDVLAPGSTLVGLRAGTAPRVTAWLSPDQVGQACLDGAAHLHGDWMDAGADLPASVTRIGTRWEYPPSSLASDEVHVLRAVAVELTAETGWLPPGAPVEITFDPCPVTSRTPAAAAPAPPTPAPPTPAPPTPAPPTSAPPHDA